MAADHDQVLADLVVAAADSVVAAADSVADHDQVLADSVVADLAAPAADSAVEDSAEPEDWEEADLEEERDRVLADSAAQAAARRRAGFGPAVWAGPANEA